MSDKKKNILTRLEAIRSLPTLPVVLDRVRKEIHNPNSNATKLARIIEDDPSMMARILKVANSALYAGVEPTRNLQMAISRLGVNAINNIALSTFVFSTLNSTAAKVGFTPKEFWKHSISAGIAVNVLYQRCRASIRAHTKDQLHLAGLIHDIGKIIFMQYFPDEFVAALEASKARLLPLFIMEQEIMGADHAQVGAWLGEKWRLVPEQIDTIRWHHEPDCAANETRDIVMLCHAANYVCNLIHLGESGDAPAPAFFPGIWKRLGIEIEELNEIVNQIRVESQKSEVLLDLLR